MATPAQILTSKFPYEPTGDQQNFFRQTEEFIKSKEAKCTLLVKGYAGTGKTSVLSALVKVLPTFGYKSLLMAPTGRAAKVMARYTGRSAFTIHKVVYKLGESRDTSDIQFKRQKNYHRNTVFIVDESSMISEEGSQQKGVLWDLVTFVFENAGNKLMLIGDDAQLPPVGQSFSLALSRDHLQEKYGLAVMEVALKMVMRQALNSGILENATKLRDSISSNSNDIQFSTAKSDVYRMLGQRMEDGLRYAYDKHGLGETIVICRSNKNAVEYNRHIRHAIFYFENELECGDQIMVVKNNYYYQPEHSPMGFLANGDFAEVLKIKRFQEMYGLRFADVEIRLLDDPTNTALEVKIILDTLHSHSPALTLEAYNELYSEVLKDYREITNRTKLRAALKKDPFLQALQVKFAYALTCHKSQGGQWKAIFLDQGYVPDTQLSKDHLRWLYTGATRATEELFLVNFDSSYFIS
ncbi:MAG: AAA family ATPase [Cyclobacteriaceae bacterium]|nr:AAA family ATPase [Cyclobacteriaceae bacterium]